MKFDDHVEGFIGENILNDVDSFVKISDLYKRYKLYCKHYGFEPVSKIKLGTRLNYLHIGRNDYRKRDDEYVRFGIRLTPCKY